MEKPKYIIGIDPDVDKSGFAIIDVACKSLELVANYSFVELLEAFNSVKDTIGQDEVVVVIEDSDNTHNWHLPKMCSAGSAAAIGKKVGLCHATQRHIAELAEYLGFKVESQTPLKKSWMGADGKITADEMRQFVPSLPNTSNQEQRDAILLAWCHANLPIHIPAEFYLRMARKDLSDQTSKVGEFFIKAKGVQPDKDGLYHNDGILTQIEEWYEKARKKAEKTKWTAEEFRKLTEDKTRHSRFKKSAKCDGALSEEIEPSDTKI